MGIANVLFSIIARAGNVIILLALPRCTSLHPTSKSLFYSLAISDLAIGLCWSAFVFRVPLSHWMGQSKSFLHCGFTTHVNNYILCYSVFVDVNSDRPGQIPRSSSSLQIPFCRESPSHCCGSHHWLVVRGSLYCFKNFRYQSPTDNLQLNRVLLFDALLT